MRKLEAKKRNQRHRKVLVNGIRRNVVDRQMVQRRLRGKNGEMRAVTFNNAMMAYMHSGASMAHLRKQFGLKA